MEKFKSDAEYNAWLDAIITTIGKLEPPFSPSDRHSAIDTADCVLNALQERTPESPFSDSSRHEQYSRHLPNIDRLPAELANAISNALQGVPGMLGAAWYGCRSEDLDNHTAIVQDVIASYLGANETVEEPDESDDDTAFMLTDKGREAVEQAIDKATRQAPLTKRLIAALRHVMHLLTDGTYYSQVHFGAVEDGVRKGIPALIEARELLIELGEADGGDRTGSESWLPPKEAACDVALKRLRDVHPSYLWTIRRYCEIPLHDRQATIDAMKRSTAAREAAALESLPGLLQALERGSAESTRVD